MDTHLANLFRNINELTHRVHSFGIVMNVLLFFLPFFAMKKGPMRTRILFMAWSFAFFVVVHSLLHWYGWKWEPRMISDASFLFFLVSTAGLMLLAGRRGIRSTAVTAVTGVALLWVAARDIPARAKTEYLNYNNAPAGLGRAIAEKKLERRRRLPGGRAGVLGVYAHEQRPLRRTDRLRARFLGPFV